MGTLVGGKRARAQLFLAVVGLLAAIGVAAVAGPGPAQAQDVSGDAAPSEAPPSTPRPRSAPPVAPPTAPPGTPVPSATPPPAATPGPGPAPTSGGETLEELPTATPPTIVYPVPDDQPPDYSLGNGHFYSQAVPGAQRGFGFSVADAAGVPFWREYQRLGGLQNLGYPTSQRFIWDDTVAQAFQGGVLRWRPQRSQADLEPLSAFGSVPEHAAVPEPPARLAAWAAHQPWSGWWWPATSLVGGAHLFDAGGPLAKYDQFVMRNGLPNPGTLDWERTELRIDVTWAGHCNGWAAAAVLEPEPVVPREAGGITFSVADQKGLLSAYHFADAAAWLHGSDDVDASPLELHQRLIQWVGNEKKGFIFTFRPGGGEEVWSYPVYRFELTMSPDVVEPDVTHVKASIWLSDNDVPAGFVGLRPWRGGGQLYEYRLIGPRDAPTGGEWEGASVAGRFVRPSYIWYPDPTHRNLDRQLVSPNLEYGVIQRILGRPAPAVIVPPPGPGGGSTRSDGGPEPDGEPDGAAEGETDEAPVTEPEEAPDDEPDQ